MIRYFNYILAVPLLAIVVGCDDGLPDSVTADSSYAAELRTRLNEKAAAEGGGEGESAQAGPAGYATLKGQFTFEGDVPTLPQLNITQNADVCAPGGKPVFDRDIAVDPATKGLSNVLIYLDKVSDDWVHEAAKTSDEEVVFDQKACVFLTRVVAINTSQSLKVLNSDPFGHNLKVKNLNESIPAGGQTTYQPKKADAVPQQMSCSVHPWMKAWFLGRDNSYFAVTKEDGSFEIPNVPAGVKLTVKVWHERTGPISGEVMVNSQPEKWKKGKLTMNIEPDSTSELNVVLNASMF